MPNYNLCAKSKSCNICSAFGNMKKLLVETCRIALIVVCVLPALYVVCYAMRFVLLFIYVYPAANRFPVPLQPAPCRSFPFRPHTRARTRDASNPLKSPRIESP
jgi:hypothetical protein